MKQRLATLNHFLNLRLGFDLAFLTKNGSWALLEQSVQSLAGLVNVMIFSRLLDKGVYGQYHFVIAVITIAAIAALPGMFSAVTRSVAQGFEGSVQEGFRKRVKFSLIGVGLLLLIAGYYFFQKESQLAIAFLLSSCFLPFLFSSELWWSFLVAKEEFDLIAKRWILIHFSMSFCLISSVLLFKNQLLPLVFSFLIVTTGYNLFYLWKTKPRISNHKTTKETFSYGWFMTKMRGMDIIIQQIDKIIIGFIHIEILAVFSIAHRMLDLSEQLISSPMSVTFPRFVSGKVQNVPNRILFGVFAFGFLLSLILILFAKPLMVLLFSDRYVESVPLFQILILALPFILISSLLKNKITAQKKESVLWQIHFNVPVITLLIALPVLLITKSIYYFFFAKVLVLKILESCFLIYHNYKLGLTVA